MNCLECYVATYFQLGKRVLLLLLMNGKLENEKPMFRSKIHIISMLFTLSRETRSVFRYESIFLFGSRECKGKYLSSIYNWN